MEKTEYLSEKKYQKTAKKISLVAFVVLLVGLSVGGFLIYNGIAKPNQSKVESLKKELEEKRLALLSQGVTPSSHYTDQEAYDLYIITNALDPSFPRCNFDEYKSNPLTSAYCKAKNSVSDFSTSASIMTGTFICIATFMISGFIFLFSKQRSILAFSTQQAMPIAQEGIDKMAPTIGNAAKEIAKGIKEGLKDDQE